MINTRTRKLLNLLLLGSVLLMLTDEKVNSCIDDAVLLENRNPGYYEYLSNSDIFYVSKAVLDEPNDNLLVNTMQTKIFSDKGFEILVHEDGSFTFSGTYTGEEPMYIYPMEIGNLKSGDYILSDGGASIDHGIQMRIFGVKKLSDGSQKYENCVSLPSNCLFHWDKNDCDVAMIDVIIYPGFSSDNLRFYPMLCDISKGNISYQDSFRKLSSLSDDQDQSAYVKFMEIKMGKRSLNRLNKGDWQILYNEIKYQNHAEWLCINFSDGTGIQIGDKDSNEMVYGEVDAVGRVRNQLNYSL